MALVEAVGLTRRFGGVVAVDDVSLALAPGRCVALLGPNGAGKTTLLNMLAGLARPSAGTVRFEGLAPGADRRALIGYLPQSPALFGWMTGREYLVFTGGLFGMKRAEAAARAGELLEGLGIAAAGDRRIEGYSGGMKQRLGIAQALVSRPPLLILDEPVSALDPAGRREMQALLRALKQTTTIIFSTHVLPDAEEVSDDVLIIRGGRIVVSSSLAELRARFRLPVIEIAFATSAEAERWQDALLPVGGAIVADGDVLGFRFEREDEAAAALARAFRLVADLQIPVRRIEVGQATLEDLFLRAVEQ